LSLKSDKMMYVPYPYPKMKKALQIGVLALVFLSVSGPKAWPDGGSNPCAIMQPDDETLSRWIEDLNIAPRAFMDERFRLRAEQRGSLSLLGYLDYIPSERDQGECGNCWVWAGTGVMAIALNVQKGIHDRLSVQYMTSCYYGTETKYACCGGDPIHFVNYYTGAGHAIPWSNTNASYQEGTRTCSDGSSDVACVFISTSPNYPLRSIGYKVIETHGVGQAEAIANIKSVLLENKAVYLVFFMPGNDDWDTMRTFWKTMGENDTWNADFSCGDDPWTDGGGHAEVCVGYNDEDPEKPYWIILNSWGDAGGRRPEGVWLLDMNINYDCMHSVPDGNRAYTYWWVTIDADFRYPSAPTGLSAVAASSSQINLSWNDDCAYAVGLVIERRKGATGTYGDVVTLATDVSSYTDKGLTQGTEYHYRLRAYDSEGNSGYSEEASATTMYSSMGGDGGGCFIRTAK
jgi:hypothetical protein